MSQEAPAVDYKDGDVVWVKLSPCWWPGEVKDINSMSDEELVNYKKVPLFFVKFFDEDSYEDVRNTANVHKYNCDRKIDFIKKGLGLLKSDVERVTKFRLDINVAEERTGGNTDILNDPVFLPQKKGSSIVNEIFGTPTSGNKKSAKSKKRLSKSPKKSTKANITHKRFLGFDDFEIRIRVQEPIDELDRNNSSDIETELCTAKAKKSLTCYMCSYQTTSFDLLFSHTKNHIESSNNAAIPSSSFSSTKNSKSSPRKSPKKSKKSTNKIESGELDDDGKPKLKRKRKSQNQSSIKAKQKKVSDDVPPPQQPPKLKESEGFCTNLLTEWDDDDTSIDNDDFLPANISTSQANCSKSSDGKNEDKAEKQVDIGQITDKFKDAADKSSSSCFDFDENEDDHSIANTSLGSRKIPRVIQPATEKRPSIDPDREDADLPVAEDDENRMEILKVNENELDANTSKSDEATFKELIESTTVPEIPTNLLSVSKDLSTLSKTTSNLPVQDISPGSSSQLSPQQISTPITTTTTKVDVENKEVATKLTNPKKRFVKSFEDFEQLQNEQKRMALEEEKREPHVVAVEETQKTEDPVVETQKSDDVVETQTADDVTEKQETDAVEETAKVEAINVEEEKVEEETVLALPTSDVTPSKNENSSADTSSLPLEISKLKCKIMSKLGDDDSYKDKDEDSFKYSTKIRGHKTPRSKYLDSCKNDNNFDKVVKATGSVQSSSKLEVKTTNKKDIKKLTDELPQPTKKSKYLKYKKGYAHSSSVQQTESEPVVEELAIKEDSTRVLNLPTEELITISNNDKSRKIEGVSSSDVKVTEVEVESVPEPDYNLDKRTSKRLRRKSDKAKSDDNETPILEEVELNKLPAKIDKTPSLLPDLDQTDDKKSTDQQPSLIVFPKISEVKVDFPAEIAKLKSPKEDKRATNKTSNTAFNEDKQVSSKTSTAADKISSAAAEEDKQISTKISATAVDDNKHASPKMSAVKEDKVVKEAPKIVNEVCSNLLADWGDDDNESAGSSGSLLDADHLLDQQLSAKTNQPKTADAQDVRTTLLAEWGDDDADSPVEQDKSSEEIEVESSQIDDKILESKLDDDVAPVVVETNNKCDSVAVVPEETVKETTESTELLLDNVVEEDGKMCNILDIQPEVDVNVEDSVPELDKETKTESNEVHFKCANIDENSSPEISIKTNLTNFSAQNIVISGDDEMSALTTLATISELKINLVDEKQDQTAEVEVVTTEAVVPATEEEEEEVATTEFPCNQIDLIGAIPSIDESELISIDGNFSVVSEKDLADGQVEITANVSDTNKKPVTLTNFSMDFSDCNSDNTNSFSELPATNYNKQLRSVDDMEVTVGDDSSSKSDDSGAPPSVIMQENLSVPSTTVMQQSSPSLPPTIIQSLSTDDLCDVEDHIPSQIVCAQQETRKDPIEEDVDGSDAILTKIEAEESTSKLLERLTEAKIMSNAQSKLASESKVPPTTNTSSSTCIIKSNKLIAEAKTIKIVKSSSSSLLASTTGIISKVKAPTTSTLSPFSSAVIHKSSIPEKMIKPHQKIIIETDRHKKAQAAAAAVVAKKNLEDVEECGIEAFIIPKPDCADEEQQQQQQVTASFVDKSVKLVPVVATTAPVAATSQFDDSFIIKKSKKQQQIIGSNVDGKSFFATKHSKKIQQQQQSTVGISNRKGGKAKILQQTIITPAGEIIQPSLPTTTTTTTTTTHNDDFDINSMPIVLSDQILTPESIENMPILMGECVQTTAPPHQQTTVTTVRKPAIIKKPPYSQVRLLNKSIASSPTVVQQATQSSQFIKSTTPKLLSRSTKILPNSTPKIIKQPNSYTSNSKYVIVTQSTTSTTTPTSRFTVGKKQQLIKRPSSSSNVNTEPVGNKIMIVTDQHGQQQRVLLTPAQQKLMGYQSSPKITKTIMKSNILQKNTSLVSKEIITSSSTAGSSGILRKNLIASSPSIISSSQRKTYQHQSPSAVFQTTSHPKNIKFDKIGRRIQVQNPRTKEFISIKSSGVSQPLQQKTVLIKNQQGQTIRKIQGTDDALLDQQVAEQLEAIKASSMQQTTKSTVGGDINMLTYKPLAKTPLRRSYSKKPAHHQIGESSSSSKVSLSKHHQQHHQQSTVVGTKLDSVVATTSTTGIIPPLAPISPRKTETNTVDNSKSITTSTASGDQKTQSTDRPLNQLIIQDAMGNQTTITEGQILALPSETIDGQPQSYMLVTLDESGNLTPLNNDALMSLDPNLTIGGDLNNTIIQIDQGTDESAKATTTDNVVEATTTTSEIDVVAATEQQHVSDDKTSETTTTPTAGNEIVVGGDDDKSDLLQQQQQIDDAVAAASSMQSINLSVSGGGAGDTSQQLIVTGDPIAAQKFLESLTEGNTDLANILASAEGSSILIQADGQILINTDSDNSQMLLSVNAAAGGDDENSASNERNPIFAAATQSTKNQDILAAALAGTDVFQQEQQQHNAIITQQINNNKSQLSPSTGSSAIYPMNVVGGGNNVLETSLTLNSPIMTPLEVPSTNSKKIVDQSDILSQVPTKNVDLPITITDPTITQTVVSSQQQVAAATLMAHELQNSLELSSLPGGGDSTTTAIMSVASTDQISSSSNNSISGSNKNNNSQFVYSLPILDDDDDDMNQKPTFNSSMPLLTEDNDDGNNSVIVEMKDQDQEIKESNSTITTSVDEEKLLTDYLKKDDDNKTTTEPPEVITESVEIVETTTTQSDEIKNVDLTKIEEQFDVIADDNGGGSSKMIDSNILTTDTTQTTFLDANEGLCTLGGEMCSSLSEPPPDMFDISEVFRTQIRSSADVDDDDQDIANQTTTMTTNNIVTEECSSDTAKVDDALVEQLSSSGSINPETTSTSSSTSLLNEDSCEIPVQPEIVTDLSARNFDDLVVLSENNVKRGCPIDEDEVDGNDTVKKCKFD